MMGAPFTRIVRVAAVGVLMLTISASPSFADGSKLPDFTYLFSDSTPGAYPAACRGFDLYVEGWNSPKSVFLSLKGVNGSAGRFLSGGKGSALVFTNLSSGATLSLDANGVMQKITSNSDGSTLCQTKGHSVLFMFSTDFPAGPSTTLYVGRLVFTMDTSANTTVESFDGTSADICALLQ